MHPNAALISTFYRAFQQRDAETMAACYTDDATFTDPAFGTLHGSEVGDMWRMLSSRAQDLEVRFSDVEADDQRGWAHWEADYLFSQTGRRVQNQVDANFEFRDGKIAIHRDEFDLWRWSRQALGLSGLLLGWTPMLRNKVQSQARRGLEKFRAASTSGAR